MEKLSEAMALESSSVSVAPLPAAPRAPVLLGGAGMTMNRLAPKPATKPSTCSAAPRPIATIVMTAPTPMMIPSIVRMDRVRLPSRERRAVLIISNKKIPPSQFE